MDASMDAEIQAWLEETLCSLSLNTDFSNRILKSAQEAVARAFQTGIEMKFEHIHLKVFAPGNTSSEKIWGFFRIEHVGTPTRNMVDHSIEFYLYREG